MKIGSKMKLISFLLSIVTFVSCQYEYEEPLLYDTFPDDFFFGVATSAFQVTLEDLILPDRGGCYICPESRVCPNHFCHPVHLSFTPCP